MRMLPESPYSIGSRAEKRIFDRLRTALDDRYVAFHSLQPTRHPSKRFAEIDFVICGPDGLYVIEVKGGRVACHNGVWQYRDLYGRTDRSQEGPFRQAETALHGLMASLRNRSFADLPRRFPTGYGVVFPDCDWSSESAEWDRAMVADARRSRNLDGWLRGLFEYWKTRHTGPDAPLDANAVRELQTRLRPDVESSATSHESEADNDAVDSRGGDAGRRAGDAVRGGGRHGDDAPDHGGGGRHGDARPERAGHAHMPLFHQVGDAQRRADRLTEDQMRMADVADANPRVLCAGGAGTGKTFLAERLARRWAETGLQVALVCRSHWLRHFLASRLAMPGLTVSTIGGIRIDRRRAGVERFDALIVDEGQDLFETGCIETLDAVLRGGLAAGRWCWFHDLNNQSLTADFEPCARDYLESLEPVRMPLRINCRNTRVILECIQDTLDADLGVGGIGAGPDVRRRTAATRQESAECAIRELDELVDRGGLVPGAVTILSPFEHADSSASLIPADTVHPVRRLDEYSARNLPIRSLQPFPGGSMQKFPGDRVGFATIEEFKGLENEAIVVLDLPDPARAARHSAAHYVAMSRARSVLSLIYLGES